MGITLSTYKVQARKRLMESSLWEIFDSPPFRSNFVFKQSAEGYSTEPFEDGLGNTIRVIFHSIAPNIYELDFTFNGDSYANPEVDYTNKEYSMLLNTVAKATSQFLLEFQPRAFKFDGADAFEKILSKPQAQGQKNRIYDLFISQLKNDTGYSLDRKADGAFNLIKKTNK
jgi:hypothetical protein